MISSDSKTDFLALDPNSIDALRPELKDEYTQMAYDYITHKIKGWLDAKSSRYLIATAKLIYRWDISFSKQKKS